MTNILNILMEKVENVQDYLDNVGRDGNSETESKENVRHEKEKWRISLKGSSTDLT